MNINLQPSRVEARWILQTKAYAMKMLKHLSQKIKFSLFYNGILLHYCIGTHTDTTDHLTTGRVHANSLEQKEIIYNCFAIMYDRYTSFIFVLYGPTVFFLSMELFLNMIDFSFSCTIYSKRSQSFVHSYFSSSFSSLLQSSSLSVVGLAWLTLGSPRSISLTMEFSALMIMMTKRSE